jgi:hypothetical protein
MECPDCGAPLEPVLSAERVMGFRLACDDVDPEDLPVAVAVALPSISVLAPEER